METSRRCTVRNLSLGQTSRGPERVRAKERKHVMAMVKEIREGIPRNSKIDINVSNGTSMIKRRSNVELKVVEIDKTVRRTSFPFYFFLGEEPLFIFVVIVIRVDVFCLKI